MKRGVLFRSTATLVIAAFVAGCASGGTTVLSLSESPVEQDVDVQLTLKTKQCGVKTNGITPDRVHAKLSRRDKVKWHIHNGCGVKLNEVKIVFEKNNTANDDTHPFDVHCKKFINDLGSGSTGTFKCQLDTNAKPGYYKYWIHINGDPAIEPDVEVWP